MTLILDVSRHWYHYLNLCVAASNLEDLATPGGTVPLSLDTIPQYMEGICFANPPRRNITAGEWMVQGPMASCRRQRQGAVGSISLGGSTRTVGGDSGRNKSDTGWNGVGCTGGVARLQVCYKSHLPILSLLYD